MTKVARAEYVRMAGLLKSIGKLTEFDRATLYRYATAWADLVKCRASIDKLPSVSVTSKRGGERLHPLLAAEEKARAELDKLSKRLGLDPYSRERLDPPAEGNPAKLTILEFAEQAKARNAQNAG